jgi:hypothetical protein
MIQADKPQLALPAAKIFAVEHLLLAAISFSDVTFNLFPGESSPLPLMLVAWLLVIRGDIRLSGAMLLGGAVFVGLAYSALFQISYSVSFTSALAYLQLLAVGAYYYKYGWSHGSDFPRMLVFFHLFVGVLQYFGAATNILEAFLTAALPRASATALGEIGRGVPFVTTEPSHALQSIALPCYLLLLEKSRDRWFSIVSLALTLLMAGAGVGYLYFIFFIGFFVYRRPAVAGASVFLVYILLAYVVPETRAGGILRMAAPLILSATVEDLRSLTALSGFRLPSVISSYMSLTSLPISFGFGSWEGSILTLMESAGYDTERLGHWIFTGEYHPVKPYSPVANLCVDFWWGGVIIALVMLYLPVKRWVSLESKGVLNPAISAFYVACLLGFLFLVTVGKPAFIAVVCMRIPQLARKNFGGISDAR